MSKAPDTLCGFDPTQEHFAGITADGRLKIWNVGARKLQNTFINSAHLQTPYTAIRWAPSSFPDGPFIALGTQSGVLLRYNFRKGIADHEWKTGETSAIYDMCFSGSGSIYIGGEFKSIIQLDFNTGKEIRKFKADNQFVSKLSITADESRLISSGSSFIKVCFILQDLPIKNKNERISTANYSNHFISVPILEEKLSARSL
jgi:WD40 repeat protein